MQFAALAAATASGAAIINAISLKFCITRASRSSTGAVTALASPEHNNNPQQQTHSQRAWSGQTMVWPVHTRAGSRRQGGDVREVGQHKIDTAKVQGHCTAFTSRGGNTHKWLVAHQKKQAQE